MKVERLGEGKGTKYHHPQLTLWKLTAIALQPMSCLFYYFIKQVQRADTFTVMWTDYTQPLFKIKTI